MKALASEMKVAPEDGGKGERACRPDSVGRFPGLTVIPLGAGLPLRSSHLPARSDGPSLPARSRVACLFGVAPGGVWRAVRVATNAVSSYLAVSPLPGAHHTTNTGGCRRANVSLRHRRSVLCATFRRLGSFDLLRLAVDQHPARWSPDLPLEARSPSDRPAHSRADLTLRDAAAPANVQWRVVPTRTAAGLSSI